MAYIGRGTDKLSNIEKLDTITFDGSSSYTLQKNSVNFTPSSANNLQVSIDGVVQAGNFTVSGSTIDFGVAIPATSTNDFIFHYGTGLITTPADGTVTTAKLADSSVSLAKLTATGTKDATTFLRGDNTFAEAGGGKVLQVVQASTTTAYTTSSSSFVAATGMEVSITPSATSSKVLVFVTMNFQEGVAGSGAYATIYRNNTTNLEANGFVYHGLASGASYKFSSQEPMHYLDSPNTTSATTYTVYFSRDGSGSATVNFNNSRGVITAIEIGA